MPLRVITATNAFIKKFRPKLLGEVKTRCRDFRKYVVDKEVSLAYISADHADDKLFLVLRDLSSTLWDACLAVENAAAMPKLQESVTALKVSEAFLLSSQFPVFCQPIEAV